MRRLICALLFCGCGGASAPMTGTGGAAAPVPTEHVLLANDPWMAAPQGGVTQPIDLGQSAVVKYTLTDRSATSPDHWDVGIFSPAELAFFMNGQPARAASSHSDVSSVTDRVTLPAGSWAIAGRCANLVEQCQASLDLSATY